MKEYKVVREFGLSMFEGSINRDALSGWECVGGMSVVKIEEDLGSEIRYHVLMVRDLPTPQTYSDKDMAKVFPINNGTQAFAPISLTILGYHN
jgi:hypothetical protein